MRGGNEAIAALLSIPLAVLLKGIAGSQSLPQMVGLDVTCLTDVIVSVPQLTAGMGRMVNRLSTMDTR